MVRISPKALIRCAIWIFLLGGCGGSKPDPKAAGDTFCAAAQVPPPASANAEVQDAHAAALAFCATRRELAKDGGG